MESGQPGLHLLLAYTQIYPPNLVADFIEAVNRRNFFNLPNTRGDPGQGEEGYGSWSYGCVSAVLRVECS